MSARTAARRRRQAVNAYSHMALIGHGNNNRPIFRKKSVSKLTRKELLFRERVKQMAARKAMSKR